MKVGVRILTIKEDATIITWILAMQKKVYKLTYNKSER
jgi:hypothetical protein